MWLENPKQQLGNDDALSRLEALPPPRPLVLAPAAGPLLEALQSLLLPDTAGLDPLSVPLPSKVRM